MSEDFTITSQMDILTHEMGGADAAAEASAEVLFEILNDPESVLRYMFPDDIQDREGFRADYPRDGELEVYLTGNDSVRVVYLAARKYAAEATKDNLSRVGYSVENILQRWSQDSDGDPHSNNLYIDDTGQVAVKGLPEAAIYALRAYCLNEAGQTPGGDIDVDAIPEMQDWDPDYDSMHPDKDGHPAK